MPQTLDQALREAIHHQQAGRLPAAEALYRAILQQAPRHADANHNLGLIALDLGQPQAALPWLKTAVAAQPAQGAYWQSYLRALLGAGALEPMTQVLAHGRARGLAGPAVDALEAEWQAARADPLGPALARREAGAYQAALDWLADYLQREPADARAWALRVQLELFHGRRAPAAEALERALALEPAAPVVQRARARLASADGDADTARALAEQALAAAPEDAETGRVLAAALAAGGDAPRACALLDARLAAVPGDADALAQRALIRMAMGDQGGDQAGAEADARAALARKPYLRLWRLLATLALARGERDAAQAAMERAVLLEPGNVAHLANLGALRRQAGDLTGAAAALERAASLDPQAPGVWLNLGVARQELGQEEGARTAYERALALGSQEPALFANLAALAFSQCAHGQALDWCGRGLALAPRDTLLLRHRAKALLALERFEEARAGYQAVLAVDPTEVGAYLGLSQLERASPGAPIFAALERAVAQTPASELRRLTNLHFALGKLYADIDAPAQAMAHYAEGHRVRARLHAGREDRPLDARWWAVLHAEITAEFFAARSGWGLDAPGPVFILGMPRSGSSLLEQMLASHSRIWGAGEREELRAFVVERLTAVPPARWSGVPSALTAAEVRTLAATQWRRLRELASGRAFVIDKLPHNFVHLWLIALAFPRAIVLHVQRDPVDTCLSCYWQNFDKAHAYSDDLAALGAHYRGYQALMRHWERVLPLAIHPVRYEDLVADPEPVLRRILDLCGLPWEPGCLDFHATRRRVNTASASQVRRPLYRDAIGRWRRYQAQLGPLLAALGEEA